MQLDTRNPVAPVLVPYLMRQLMTSEYYADGQRLLLDWDFTQPADSAAAAYFNVVWRNVLRLDLRRPAARVAVARRRRSLGRGGQQPAARAGQPVVGRRRAPTSVVEDRDEILTEAMHEARDELTRRMSVSPKQWPWGRLHQLELEHPSLGQGGISASSRALFNRGPFDVGGGTAIVDATGWNAADGYDVTSAPVDADGGRPRRPRPLPVGQPHRRVRPRRSRRTTATRPRLWIEGRTLPWVFGRDAVSRAAEERLALEPSEPD